MLRSLLIDDTRLPGDKYKGIPQDAVVARTYAQGIELLKTQTWDKLYLDHDLGDFTDVGEMTGMHVLGWLENNLEHVPGEIHIVTDNAAKHREMRFVARELMRKSSNVEKE